jgi:hypothetical protein
MICKASPAKRSADILSASGRCTLRLTLILNSAWFALRAQADRMSALRRRCRKMLSMSKTDDLNQKLRALDAEFDREMRARGFDPAQLENVALPSHLAELYKQREQIKAELAALAEEKAGEKSND